jgi:hypothetical protein
MIISDLNYVKSTKQTVRGGVPAFAGIAESVAEVVGTRSGTGLTTAGTAGSANAVVRGPLPVFASTSVSIGANALASGNFLGIGGLTLASAASVAGNL